MCGCVQVLQGGEREREREREREERDSVCVQVLVVHAVYTRV